MILMLLVMICYNILSQPLKLRKILSQPTFKENSTTFKLRKLLLRH